MEYISKVGISNYVNIIFYGKESKISLIIRNSSNITLHYISAQMYPFRQTIGSKISFLLTESVKHYLDAMWMPHDMPHKSIGFHSCHVD